MPLKAKVYVGLVISLGATALGSAMYLWETANLVRFLCYLALAIPASFLKVKLPGIRLGTMSVFFVFVLGAIVELNLPETMVIGVISVVAQSLWHSRFGVRLVQLAFSVATIALAVVAGEFAYHSVPFLSGAMRLAVTVSVLFVCN